MYSLLEDSSSHIADVSLILLLLISLHLLIFLFFSFDQLRPCHGTDGDSYNVLLNIPCCPQQRMGKRIWCSIRQVRNHTCNHILCIFDFKILMCNIYYLLHCTTHNRAIKYHRTMGVLFWVFSTFHMLLFQIKWIRKGVLIQNAWSEVP